MTQQFVYQSYQKDFSTIPEIIAHMQALQKELQNTELANLRFFNSTYLIITKNVFSQTDGNYFVDKQLLKKLDINFAGYYFDALKDYVDGKQTTPAWKIAFDFYKKNTSMPIIYLALGVNAHVNNDLGLSLFDVLGKTDFKSDFDKINPIIFASIDEIIAENRLPKFYKPFMKKIIYNWRYNAWKNYKKLKDETRTKVQIETNAAQIASALTKINNPF